MNCVVLLVLKKKKKKNDRLEEKLETSGHTITIYLANPSTAAPTEQQQWAKWDKEYPTPNFSIRQCPDSEKLIGPKKFPRLGKRL